MASESKQADRGAPSTMSYYGGKKGDRKHRREKKEERREAQMRSEKMGRASPSSSSPTAEMIIRGERNDIGEEKQNVGRRFLPREIRLIRKRKKKEEGKTITIRT